MSLSQFVNLEVDGAAGTFRVLRFTGRERLHAPFVFALVCQMEDEEIRPEDLLTRAAKITLKHSGGERIIEGLVDQVELVATGLRLSIVPRIALLADAVDHRVFVEQDTVAIVTDVLGKQNIAVDVRVRRSLPKRSQCVQAFESGLAFASRLLAEDGIAWYLPLEGKDVVALVDFAGGFDELEGELPVRERGGLDIDESVYGARVRRTMVTDKVTFRDYDFERPALDLTAEADSGRLERYEYPGGYADPGLGRALARIRLEDLHGRKLVLQAESSSRRLLPGYVISLCGGARDDIQGRWLILEVDHDGSDHGAEGDERYVARFTAVMAADGYRPARLAPPRMTGVQTATVTGAGGAEIHTEKHGRIKVHLRWDRERPFDDTASSWVRTVQPPTSGSFFLPRMKWEIILGFWGVSADYPIALGRVYNGETPPPNALPGDKVVSAFGTQTTPGGGSANLVAMNDTAGKEGVTFNASRDFNERTENDKVTEVTANDTWTVGAERKVIVGAVHEVAVEGAQSYTVAAKRTVNVNADKTISAASETVMVGGLRVFNVGGDYGTQCATLTRLVGAVKAELAIESHTRSVLGAATVLVGGAWSEKAGLALSVNTAGASTEVVSGAKSIKASKYEVRVRGALKETLASRKIKAGGDRNEIFGAAATYKIGGSAKIKGSEVVVKAKHKITLKASGITVKITPGGITIDGAFDGKSNSVDEGEQNYD
ncbi:type VI secretion system Vgr family protein [Sorangium sp. So ce362]|uniref:type VI secretion system Vgr family protein n=1 Tax=Sorangium sp. So ce362 TaxID=3133303 RepID=UPI003F5FB12D